MLAISNGDISPGSVETQQMRVMASKGVSIGSARFLIPVIKTLRDEKMFLTLPLSPPPPFSNSLLPLQSQIRLRLRVAFSKNGESIQDQVDFSGFPAGLMA